MNTIKIGGLYTALLTPFRDNDLSIDIASLKKLVERQVCAGIQGIVVCGSTGEASTLSIQEHCELISKTTEIVDKRIQVIAGTGSNSTETAVELSIHAEKLGADGLLVVNPYYNNPSQEGLYYHFTSIADSVSIPLILYNIPARTVVNIGVDTLVRLAQHSNIVAIKEAISNFNEIIEKKHCCPKEFIFLCGDDNVMPAFMGLGGAGLISVISNVYPTPINSMVAHYLRGDYVAANDIFYRYLDIMNMLFIETNPVPVKAAAHHLKMCGAKVRSPLVALTPEHQKKLYQLLDAQKNSD